MRLRVLSLVGLTILPQAVVAQTPAVAAAQGVSTAFFKAIEASDWKAAASFLDLAVVDSERRSAVEQERRRRTMAPMTVERLMRMDPEMPRAAAEYQVKRMNMARQSVSYLQNEFGIADPDSLLALPMEVVAARWLEAHDERAMFRQALRLTGSCPVAAADTVPGPTYRIIGTVVDDSTAYTLFRQGGGGMISEPDPGLFPPKVLQLKQSHGTWWVVPSADMRGFVGMAVNCGTATSRKPGGA